MITKERISRVPTAWLLAFGLALTCTLVLAPVPGRAQTSPAFAQYRAAFLQGRYDEAERIARSSLEAAERRGDVEAASGWADLLATVFISSERFADAEPLLRRSLEFAERRFGDQGKTMKVVDLLGQTLMGLGKFEEAERLFQRSLEVRTRLFGPASKEVSYPLEHLAHLALKRGRYPEAEEFVRRSLEINQRINHVPGIRQDLANLAQVTMVRGRLDEAERIYLRVIDETEKQAGAEHMDLVMPLNNLASIYKDQGRFEEAERLLQRSLRIAFKSLGPSSLLVAKIWGNLGAIYIDQARYDEGASMIGQALNLYVKNLGPEHSDVSLPLNNLGDAALHSNHLDVAEQLYRQALAIDEKTLGPAHRTTALRVHNLGLVAELRGQFPEAEARFRDALARREKAVGAEHADTAQTLMLLGHVLLVQGKNQEALEILDRALAILDQPGIRHRWRAEACKIRAQAGWALGRRVAALQDLNRALDQDEQLRTQAGGSPREIAEVFAQSAFAFELMAAYQSELGNVEQAFAAIERFRARSLIDEMKLAGSDLTEGMLADRRRQFRANEHELNSRINRLERRLAGLTRDQEDERLGVEHELADAQLSLYKLDRDLRGSSLVYRRLVTDGGPMATLAEIQNRLLHEGDLLLVYVIAQNHGLVFAVTRGTARVDRVELSVEHAKVLGVAPGPLTDDRLSTILSGEAGTSVLPRLTNPKAPVPTNELFALWQTLVPEPERLALAEGKYKRLLVVPDGPLSLLPFETLVVEPNGVPKYLLDVGPPMLYGPSANVLLNLAESKAEAVKEDEARETVLALGDPAYANPDAPGASRGVGRDGARYSLAGGKLPRLPYSNWEAQWVVKGFTDSGIKAVALLGPDATERGFRHGAPGRKLVHLACHGLVDRTYGNAFGALALTPGPNPLEDPSDDGFLTLRELYAVDLRSCELAILSACQTNLGKQQIGEGTWSFSRGFLAAGARRVVASNWLVDDEAAASLVSVYCTLLAKAQKEGKPADYAGALHKAKRWVRGQDKWKAPYYWGSLVLVGPP